MQLHQELELESPHTKVVFVRSDNGKGEFGSDFQPGFGSMTLHDTFGNMAWIWMLTNNRQVEWVDMDPLWKWIHIVEMNPRSSNLLT
jgi:hypothetical protein